MADDIVEEMKRRDSVLLTAILSIIFPGLGHLYLGEADKGVKILIAAIVGIILTFLVIGMIIYLIVWVYALYDSVMSVHRPEKDTSGSDESGFFSFGSDGG